MEEIRRFTTFLILTVVTWWIINNTVPKVSVTGNALLPNN